MDSKGNLYGTTFVGGDLNCTLAGEPGCGVVFKLAPSASSPSSTNSRAEQMALFQREDLAWFAMPMATSTEPLVMADNSGVRAISASMRTTVAERCSN